MRYLILPVVVGIILGFFLPITLVEPAESMELSLTIIGDDALNPGETVLSTPYKGNEEDDHKFHRWTMDNCSCVSYMREEKGHVFPRVNTPADLVPNSSPVVGGLILYKFGTWDHMGEIVDLRPGGAIIDHRYLSGEKCITEMGFVEWGDIRGVYTPEI